jgi:hypothetical protein
MIKTFFRRWWLSRQLYRYIYWKGQVLDVMTHWGTGKLPDLHNSTRDDRIRLGVADEMFLTWYLQGRIAKLLNDNSKVVVRKTFNEIVPLGWVEARSDRWNVGLKGPEVYAWYYPIIVFLKFVDNNKALTWMVRVITLAIAAWFLFPDAVTLLKCIQ